MITSEKAILFDATRCIACRSCQVACKQWNGLAAEKTAQRGAYQNPSSLSADTWLTMLFAEAPRGADRADWVFTRRSCMHCTEAVCVQVCPTGALTHHETGFVAYDRVKCDGCGNCAQFCPFMVPKMRDDPVTGQRKAEKCVFCADRVRNGQEPACVKTCAGKALTFRDRDELLALGRDRVQAMKASNPDAYLYGDSEVGGTHVLYVLTHHPTVHMLPVAPSTSESLNTWKKVILPAGGAVMALACVGLGITWLVARRNANAPHEAVTRWMCPTCGYIHRGDQPPERCPLTHDAGERFVKLEE